MLSGTVPIHLELRTMKINPLKEEAQCSMRELAGHVARGDLDDYFGPLASGCGRPVITIRMTQFSLYVLSQR